MTTTLLWTVALALLAVLPAQAGPLEDLQPGHWYSGATPASR